MTTIPQGMPAGRLRFLSLVPTDVWASLAITVIWLAVLFDAVFGPDIVSTTATTTSRVPSAVAVAFFAFLATWVVARYGLRQDEEHK